MRLRSQPPQVDVARRVLLPIAVFARDGAHRQRTTAWPGAVCVSRVVQRGRPGSTGLSPPLALAFPPSPRLRCSVERRGRVISARTR